MTTRVPEPGAGPRPRLTYSRVLVYAALVLFAIYYLMPVYVLVVTGLKSFADRPASYWAVICTITGPESPCW